MKSNLRGATALPWQLLLCLVSMGLSLQPPGRAGSQVPEGQESAPAQLRARIEASPLLNYTGVPFAVDLPAAGPEPAAASGVAVDSKGIIYLLRRSDHGDPIVALDRSGRILRSWGKGDFTIPHSIRIGPNGDIWTVDAAASNVIEYTRLGKKLRTIHVGGQPENGSPFRGTTDIAFAPNGRIFISDGYGNARILEYTADGRPIRQWGQHGSAPGEFNLPHALQIDGRSTLYVADRENGRIQEFDLREFDLREFDLSEFDLRGRFLRELDGLGRTYSIGLSGGALWVSMGPFDQPPGAPGWIVKLDPQSGKILGHLDVAQQRSGHSLALTPSGEPLITVGTGLLWFHRR